MHDHTSTYGDASGDKTPSQRALELRKFFAPFYHSTSPGWSGGVKATITSDGALDAFAETVLWRLRGVRTMVSLIDRTTQYFLAGAAREGNENGDELSLDRSWFGCDNVSTPGGLCENTLAVDGAAEQYPCFIVTDLREDERFARLPVVDGSVMAYRFYGGTPITTQHGVNIGSLFIFDDKPRPEGLTLHEKKFLFETAFKVMRHLETKREAAERRRVALMSKGIASFLETTAQVTEADLESSDASETSRKGSLARKSSSNESARSSLLVEEQFNGFARDGKTDNMADTTPSSKVLDQIKITLDHAANILRESLELTSGGVLFLDTGLGSKDVDATNDYFDLRAYPGFEVEQSVSAESKILFDSALGDPTPAALGATTWGGSSPGQVRSFNDQYQPAKILTMSVSENTNWNPSTKKPDGKTLQTLISTYPKGNIWYIDEEGYFSSIEQVDENCDGQTPTPSGKRRSRPPFDMARQRDEADLLSGVFENARQIMFLPLWDAGGNRWYAGCFAWSQHAVPVFTVDSEIAYLSAFTNSMMVEISRLEAITANKMKSDFISSISHEFRSPLHGILASTEFLRDSELDSTQSEFISTIQNCGSTLLDTINHVLDYSKINSFEKKGLKTGSLSNELYQCSDVALLCEEIVYGMMAAKEFTGITDSSTPHRHSGFTPNHSHDPQVHMILDFENRNWKYRIQSGAIRRVVMNIFGNSNKYTESGFIMVQLRIREIEKVNPATAETLCQHVLIMRIIDSGRGMSTEYMERKLFTPFAQEDSFSPGIGLGLSIVWSIVNQLGGMIHIRSELGRGTEVEVNLPLEKSDSNINCSSMARSDIEVSGSTEAQENVEAIRKIARGKTVAIIRDNINHTNGQACIRPKWQCIEKYISSWFGFTIIDAGDKHKLKDVDLIIGEKDGAYLKTHILAEMNFDRILLIRDGMTCVQERRPCSDKASVETIWNPIGPYKLARAILLLFKGVPKPKSVGQKTSLEVPSNVTEEPRISTPSTGTSTPLSSTKQSEPDMGTRPVGETDTVLEALTIKPASDNLTKSEPLGTPAITTIKDTNAEDTGIAQALKDTQSLPVARPTSPGSPIPSFSPSMLSPQIEDDVSLHILAVDDNTLNLQLLYRYLTKRPNDNVGTARNGVEAVAAVRQAKIPFDVILMDLSMPEMDGFEATRLIRVFERSLKHREASEIEDHTATIGDPALMTTPNQTISELRLKQDHTPTPTTEETSIMHLKPEPEPEPPRPQTHAYIVALTGLASRRDRDEAEESGFDDFLTKPISFGKIGELLARLSGEKGRREGC